jgi:hypothetical protein
MQRQTHQSTFAGRRYIRNREDRFRRKRAVLVNAHASWSFSEQHAIVWRPHDGPGNFEVPNNRFDAKTYWRLAGRLRRYLNFASAATGGRTLTPNRDKREDQ